MMVRAQNRQVVNATIERITIYVVHLDQRLSVNRMTLIPTAHLARIVCFLKDVGPNSLLDLHGFTAPSDILPGQPRVDHLLPTPLAHAGRRAEFAGRTSPYFELNFTVCAGTQYNLLSRG
jgi:hypothetical protein